MAQCPASHCSDNPRMPHQLIQHKHGKYLLWGAVADTRKQYHIPKMSCWQLSQSVLDAAGAAMHFHICSGAGNKGDTAAVLVVNTCIGTPIGCRWIQSNATTKNSCARMTSAPLTLTTI